jgi:hypothetical protein
MAAAAAACITLGPVVADAAAAGRCGYVSTLQQCVLFVAAVQARPCCAVQHPWVVRCVLVGWLVSAVRLIGCVFSWDGGEAHAGRRMRTD